MNFKDLWETLDHFPAELTPCLWGTHGIGKTEVVRQISKDLWGLRCIELQGSQLSDQGDLIGLQKIFEWDEEEEQVIDGKTVKVTCHRQETRWIPPYWFPKDGKPFVLFLDELNRAEPPIKRAMMQLGNDHKILNMALPEGSRVIVAGNPSAEGYDTEEFDDAEMDRFQHFIITPTKEEWEDHERKIGGQEWVISYFAKHPDDLDPYSFLKENKMARGNGTTSGVAGINKLPSRRSATRFDKITKAKLDANPQCFDGAHGLAILQQIASACFGDSIAKKIRDWYDMNGRGLKPADFIVGDWKKYKKEIEKLATNMLSAVTFAKGVIAEIDRLEKDGALVSKGATTPLGKTVAENWEKFLTTIPKEAAARIHGTAVETARKNKDAWVAVISHINRNVMKIYLDLADIQI